MLAPATWRCPARSPDPCGFATGRFGLAACFGASTVMLGSGAAEPAAVCDTAVPLKLHSNEIKKIAIAEGTIRLDDILIAIPSRAAERLRLFHRADVDSRA